MTVNIASVQEYQDKMMSVAKETGHFSKIKLNRFWSEENPVEIKKLLEANKTVEDILSAISFSHLYQINFSDSVQSLGIQHMAEMFERVYGKEELDSLISNYADGECFPESLTDEYKGKRVTLDFFRYLAGVLNIKNNIVDKGEKIESVFELGSGLGSMSRLINLIIKPKRYYICDLPQSIIFSYLFLNKYLPEYKHVLIENEEQLAEQLKDEQDNVIVFIPSVFAEKISEQKFDLFVNTQSMGEMHNDTIAFWFNFFQKENHIKYGYFLNRFLGIYVPGEMNEWRLNENTSSISFDKKWKMLHWDHEPFFMKCPFGFTSHARPVEIICQRIDEDNATFKDEKEAIEWFENLDFFSGKFSMNNYIHSFSAYNISSDGSMGSALHKVWEAGRQFDKSYEVTEKICSFLKLLRREEKLVFEEEPFYWKRLEQIDAEKAKAFLDRHNKVSESSKVQGEPSRGIVLKLLSRIKNKVKTVLN